MLNPLLDTVEEVGLQLRYYRALRGTEDKEADGITVTLLGWETWKVTMEIAITLGELKKYWVWRKMWEGKDESVALHLGSLSTFHTSEEQIAKTPQVFASHNWKCEVWRAQRPLQSCKRAWQIWTIIMLIFFLSIVRKANIFPMRNSEYFPLLKFCQSSCWQKG